MIFLVLFKSAFEKQIVLAIDVFPYPCVCVLYRIKNGNRDFVKNKITRPFGRVGFNFDVIEISILYPRHSGTLNVERVCFI